jgi:hypothetical protein
MKRKGRRIRKGLIMVERMLLLMMEEGKEGDDRSDYEELKHETLGRLVLQLVCSDVPEGSAVTLRRYGTSSPCPFWDSELPAHKFSIGQRS